MKPRNKSLDLFRGFTVLWMVIVNNPGNWGQIYVFFKHAAWDGLGSADFVFPFFLIAVGASVPLAYAKRKSQFESDARILIHVLLRSLLLVVIGLVLNGFPIYKWDELRIPGVLQRIGIVYFLTYVLYLTLSSSQRLGLFAFILVAYTYIIVYCPPPDWNLVNSITFQYDPKYNWAAYLDRLVLKDHLWKVTKVWDPEGILSTIPSIASALIGVWLSEWKVKVIDSEKKSMPSTSTSTFCFRFNYDWKILGFGLGFLVLGFLIAVIFPINKSLWSSSFVLITGGSAYLLLWVLSHLPENWQRSKFFDPILLLGQSALFVFVFTGFLSRILNLPLWENQSLKTKILSMIGILYSAKSNSLLYAFIYLFFIISITWIWRKVYQRI